MSTVAVIWFLVITTGRGAVVIPEPYLTEASCKAEVARIARPASEGGMPSGFGYCVRAERAKP